MDPSSEPTSSTAIIMDQLQVHIIIIIIIIIMDLLDQQDQHMDQLQQRRGIRNETATIKDHRLEESGGEDRAPLVGKPIA